MSQAVRQGDVLMVRVAEIPSGARPVEPEDGRLIVARGEVTGHHHSVGAGPNVALFMDTGSSGVVNSPLYLEVRGEPVSLEHQEHSALVLEPGKWRYLQQRTLNSAGRVSAVMD